MRTADAANSVRFPIIAVLAAGLFGLGGAGLAAGTFLPAPDAQPEAKSQPDRKPADAKRPEKPGVPLGTKVGEATLIDEQSKEVKFSSLFKDGPVVVTFYRGGWCPFCTKALSAWNPKLDELKAAGATFIAITPETPELLVKTKEKSKGRYRVLCDRDMEASKLLKVIFQMDEATQQKYRGYGVDLTKNNANHQWELPAPATFVIDKDGIVRWSFADWDYTKRAEPDEVIKAVKALSQPAPKPGAQPAEKPAADKPTKGQ